MALTSEDLLAISQLLDAKLKPVEDNIKVMSERIDDLEMQIKHTERTLKNEIRKSESLILDEVERVHNILDKHKQDKKAHSA